MLLRALAVATVALMVMLGVTGCAGGVHGVPEAEITLQGAASQSQVHQPLPMTGMFNDRMGTPEVADVADCAQNCAVTLTASRSDAGGGQQ